MHKLVDTSVLVEILFLPPASSTAFPWPQNFKVPAGKEEVEAITVI